MTERAGAKADTLATEIDSIAHSIQHVAYEIRACVRIGT
jgi:hypothetical protein